MRWKRALLALAMVVMPLVPATAGEHADNANIGRKLFIEGAQPACGICHTLRDAGTSGTIGPNLDDLKPNRDRVAVAVRKGVGVMPPYGEQLSAQQIEALAHYVSGAVVSTK